MEAGGGTVGVVCVSSGGDAAHRLCLLLPQQQGPALLPEPPSMAWEEKSGGQVDIPPAEGLAPGWTVFAPAKG